MYSKYVSKMREIKNLKYKKNPKNLNSRDGLDLLSTDPAFARLLTKLRELEGASVGPGGGGGGQAARAASVLPGEDAEWLEAKSAIWAVAHVASSPVASQLMDQVADAIADSHSIIVFPTVFAQNVSAWKVSIFIYIFINLFYIFVNLYLYIYKFKFIFYFDWGLIISIRTAPQVAYFNCNVGLNVIYWP